MFSELRIFRCFVFVCFFVCFWVWKWMNDWMSLRCHSCAQTLDRGERCLGPGELLKPGRKGLLWRFLERPLLPGNVLYLLNTSANIFCQYCSSREDFGRAPVLKSICQAFWPSPTTTQDRKRTTNQRRHVWWVECFALCYFRSVHGWIGLCGDC